MLSYHTSSQSSWFSNLKSNFSRSEPFKHCFGMLIVNELVLEVVIISRNECNVYTHQSKSWIPDRWPIRSLSPYWDVGCEVESSNRGMLLILRVLNTLLLHPVTSDLSCSEGRFPHFQIFNWTFVATHGHSFVGDDNL